LLQPIELVFFAFVLGYAGIVQACIQMKVARVCVAKSEVKKMIQEEIRRLEGAE